MRIARPLIFVLLLGVSGPVAAEPVFNNLDGPHDGGGWWNKDPEDMTAQPFQLGNHTTVSSVSLRLDPRGQPDDTLYLNLYNDDAGKPGTIVGSLGTLDSLTVANGGVGTYVFDTPVSGLTPEETYHLVLSHDGTNWNDPSPRIFWRMTSQTGAAGAGQALAIEPNFCVTDWHTAHNYPCGGPPFPVWFFASVDAPLRGDFDGDGSFTTADIDTLTTEIVAGPPYEQDFDLSNDSTVDHLDLTTWLSNAGQQDGRSHAYKAGDSNLDGLVAAADLNNLALNWQQSISLWSRGDFTADGVVNSSDLNELALNWRTFVPFAGAAVIKAGSDAYVQTFDEALGTGGGVTGTNLPTGWTVTDNGSVSDATMRPFPIGATMTGSGAANAGAEHDPDRALAIGVIGSEDDLSLRLLAHTTVADAESFQLQFDVEAWDAVDGIRIGNTVILGPDDPGEAAFKLTVDIDSGDGFTSLADLGTITSGPTLQPVREGIVDGNADANRVVFDSGIISARIPADSKLRFSWAPDVDAETNGWIFGIDNVSLRLFTASSTAIPASVPEPSGLLLMFTGLALAWRRPRSQRRPARPRLHMEALEDRTLLTVFTVTNLNDIGGGSLRQAILDSNGNVGADVISFVDDLKGTIGLTSGELVITGDLTIDGPGSDELTVSGSGLTRVFSVGGSTVVIDDLTITGGVAGDTLGPIALGGGILNQGGELTVSGVTFVGNRAAGLLGGGGAIANVFEASTTVVDSTFSGNLASGIIVGVGGAIANDVASTLRVSDSTFTGNQATGSLAGAGGAIANQFGSQTTVSDSTFDSNLAQGANGDPGGAGGIADGGAIANVALGLVLPGFVPPTLNVSDSTFVGNQSVGGAGGDGGPGTDGGIGGVGSGGAIVNINATLTVADSKFRENQAVGGVGGIGGADANGGNGSNGRGGAIINTAFLDAPFVPTTLNIADSKFVRNTATGGAGGSGGPGGNGGDGGEATGGGLRNAVGTMNVAGSKLKFNEATGGSGGDPGDGGSGGNGGNGLGGGMISGWVVVIIGQSITANVSGTSITNNRATGGVGGTGGNGGNGLGGGIYNHVNSTITLTDSKVNANRAVGHGAGASGVGGGVYNAGTINIDKSPNIHGNKASTSHDDVFGNLTLVDDLLALV